MEQRLRSKVLEAAQRYSRQVFGKPKSFQPGDRILFAGRVFDEQEIENLVDASLDFWLTAGRYADDFEEKFSRFLGVKCCSLVNSGSSANLLAFMALTSTELGERRIKKGDEVITVAAAFPTTVAPIIQYGAVPVFVDVALPTYNIDCAVLEPALSERTKAVMLAHTLGNPFDIGAVRRFCAKHGLWLIEDNCDALGSRYNSSLIAEHSARLTGYTGSFGHLSTHSFYPAHHMTMGEGGAVCTDDPLLNRLVNSFRDWGRDCWCGSGHDNTCGRRFEQRFGELPFGYDHKYVYSHFGYNLKITDMQAAIGCAQLDKLPSFIESRKKNWQYLRDALTDLSDRFIFAEPTPGSEPSWFGFLLTVREDAGFSRDEIVNHAEGQGIQTRMLFAGNIVRHPCFDGLRAAGTGFRVVAPSAPSLASPNPGLSTPNLKTTDLIMRNTFWIGVYPGLTEEMLAYMAQTLHSFVRDR
jgi:CDP-4-dehydro-6-deoxyglucose reductase, E1